MPYADAHAAFNRYVSEHTAELLLDPEMHALAHVTRLTIREADAEIARLRAELDRYHGREIFYCTDGQAADARRSLAPVASPGSVVRATDTGSEWVLTPGRDWLPRVLPGCLLSPRSLPAVSGPAAAAAGAGARRWITSTTGPPATAPGAAPAPGSARNAGGTPGIQAAGRARCRPQASTRLPRGAGLRLCGFRFTAPTGLRYGAGVGRACPLPRHTSGAGARSPSKG